MSAAIEKQQAKNREAVIEHGSASRNRLNARNGRLGGPEGEKEGNWSMGQVEKIDCGAF